VLSDKSRHVSQLARDIGISRPLLIMHLKRLEDARLVTSKLELSRDGKAIRVYQIKDFDLHITPEVIASAAQ
jgi:ArsR family transcriptional regulator